MTVELFKCPECGNDFSFVEEDLDKNVLACKDCIVFRDLD